MADMDVKIKRKGDVLIVDIRGKVGIVQTPHLKEALEGLYAEDGDVIVNLASIQYIDSSCLGALITVRKELEKRGHRLRLAEPNTMVRDVLGLTKLDSFFEVCETEAEAMEQLRSG